MLSLKSRSQRWIRLCPARFVFPIIGRVNSENCNKCSIIGEGAGKDFLGEVEFPPCEGIPRAARRRD